MDVEVFNGIKNNFIAYSQFTTPKTDELKKQRTIRIAIYNVIEDNGLVENLVSICYFSDSFEVAIRFGIKTYAIQLMHEDLDETCSSEFVYSYIEELLLNH